MYTLGGIDSDSKGYEHTEEFIEDVGMSIAQSVVFSASRFNPMAETKLRAMAIMHVLGFKRNEIGDTSPNTVRRLFDALKVAR